MTWSPTLTPMALWWAVPELGAVGERLDGPVAVGAGVAGLGDDAVGDREDRRARGGGEVEAGVVARPEPAGHAEAGGQVVALGGQVPLVLGDLAGAGLGGLAQRLQLGVALGGLFLGGLLELGVGGVLQGLALGVTAQCAGARSADVADRVGAGELPPWEDSAMALSAGCWWPTVIGSGAGDDQGNESRDGRERGKASKAAASGLHGASTTGSGRGDRGPTSRRALPAAMVRSVLSHGQSCRSLGTGGDPPR